MGVNSMFFDASSVEKGSHLELVKYLIGLSYEEDSPLYCDIRIVPEDMGAVTVQWAQVPWGHEYGGEFRYIDSDAGQVVMFEQELPDGSITPVYSEAEGEELLQEWLKEHPQWKRNSFGRWFDETEIIPNDTKEQS